MPVTGEGISRGVQLYKIDPRAVIVDESKNYRDDYGDIDELAEFIKNGNKIPPIDIRKTKNSKFELIAGYRRMRAVMQLIKAGEDIESIPAYVAERGISDQNILLNNINSNAGLKPTPLELMNAFERLVNYGVAEKEIARRTGKSVAYVKYILTLKNASPEMVEAIKTKAIPITTATKIIAKSNGSTVDQKAGIEQAKADKQAKKKAAKPPKAPSKPPVFKGGFQAPPPPVMTKTTPAKAKPKGWVRNEQGADFEPLIELVSEEIKSYEPGQSKLALKEDVEKLIEMLEDFHKSLDEDD